MNHRPRRPERRLSCMAIIGWITTLIVVAVVAAGLIAFREPIGFFTQVYWDRIPVVQKVCPLAPALDKVKLVFALDWKGVPGHFLSVGGDKVKDFVWSLGKKPIDFGDWKIILRDFLSSSVPSCNPEWYR